MEEKESSIVKRILSFLKKNYSGFYFKSHGGLYQRKGLPDIIGCNKGRFVGIEVKRPNKRNNTTASQKQVLSEIKNAGGISGVATSIDEVRRIMDEAIQGEILG